MWRKWKTIRFDNFIYCKTFETAPKPINYCRLDLPLPSTHYGEKMWGIYFFRIPDSLETGIVLGINPKCRNYIVEVQGWFQGPPRTWYPLMVSFPYFSHIIRDSYGNCMGPAYHYWGSHVLGGPWKSHWEVGSHFWDDYKLPIGSMGLVYSPTFSWYLC